jgi:2-polyprenyl-3-methyl-5-hydroxy-6-metoxy-1,4-benzoquinol methylase
MRMEGCNLCGGTEWTVLEEVSSTRVVRCSCGLVFVTPQPDRSTIEQAYGEEYYSPWEEQTALRAGIWRRRLDDVGGLRQPPGDLLDVGCGTGVFLSLARERQWRVTGTELSAYACRAAGAQGIRALQGEVWEARLPDDSFDVVTCWHAIEHAGDPKRVVRECHRLLRPGGWLLLATPNVEDRIFRAAYRLARGRRPPLYEADERELHLFHFSPRTLEALLASAGFREVTVGFDRGAAAVWSKRAVNEAAYVWFRLTGVNWGMALTAAACKS